MTAKKINLALQGGGAHGAYTWGVLDRLLEEKSVHIEGISGTSAGAMNAAMFVNGFMHGGREGAKTCLETFWKRISEAAAFSPLHKSPVERMLTGWNMDLSPAYHWLDLMSRIFSPYEINPLNINPMRAIVEDMLDTKALSTYKDIKLFVTATHVASGQARVFKSSEINPDVLVASACIPFMFQAVEVKGEHYWDGGYMGNPSIWPLIYNCQSEDVVLVQINPIHDNDLPRTAGEIINRLNEISFNSSLIAEMRAIDFVSRLLDQKKLDPKHYKKMRVHLIYSADDMHHLNASSKMNADWDFFLFLKKIGRECADNWLRKHWADIGKKSTIDIREKFLCGPGMAPVNGELVERKKAPPMPKRNAAPASKKKAEQHHNKKIKKRK